MVALVVCVGGMSMSRCCERKFVLTHVKIHAKPKQGDFYHHQMVKELSGERIRQFRDHIGETGGNVFIAFKKDDLEGFLHIYTLE